MKHTPTARSLHKCVRGRGCPGPAGAAHEIKRELYIGDVAASTKPVALHTLLGSCVAVCLHDSRLSIGGMNHILLPGGSHQDRSTRFGIHAMELLIDTLLKIGAERKRLVAKAFGGANVLPCFQAPTVGDHNVSFVRDFLASERIPLIAQRLGGSHAVRVHFRTHTGRTTVQSVDGNRLPAIVAEECAYCAAHAVERLTPSEANSY